MPKSVTHTLAHSHMHASTLSTIRIAHQQLSAGHSVRHALQRQQPKRKKTPKIETTNQANARAMGKLKGRAVQAGRTFVWYTACLCVCVLCTGKCANARMHSIRRSVRNRLYWRNDIFLPFTLALLSILDLARFSRAFPGSQ